MSEDTSGGDVRCAARWSAVASVLLLVVAAFAQDTVAPPAHVAPPAPAAASLNDPLEGEVDAIRRLVLAGVWKAGKLSIDAFFAAHAGDPRVLAHLAELESDLQTCLFRLDGRQPTPVQLLGRFATKYDEATGRVEFKVTEFAADAGWRAAGDARFFDVLFDGEVSVEMSYETASTTVVLLGFDPETRGAYAFVPGAGSSGPAPFVYRIDPGGNDPVKLGEGGLLADERTTESVKYTLSQSRVGSEIQRSREWKWERRDVRTFEDGRYRRGFVAVRGASKLDARGLLIAGKLESTFAKRQIAEADSRRFREWSKARWDRTTALPAWVIGLEKSAGAWAEKTPGDCPPEFRREFVHLQRATFETPSRMRALRPLRGLFGATADWQDGLFALADRRLADAETSARKVMDAEPDFAAAYALAGRARLMRGDEDAAGALFEESRRRDATFAPAYDGLALAAFRAGDVDRMQSALEGAAAAGVATSLTAELRQVLLRVRRGPNWKKRFDSYSPNYAISGDASVAVCNDVAKILEEANDIYARQFRRRPHKTRGRVRVFSGFGSYADYLSELGADATNTLGMYLPSLRELCVFLHEDRPELSNTIRHEGFHQYLHDFLDDVPIWFNEGYAEFFGFSRRKESRAVVGQVDEEQAALARKLAPGFTPLSKLFLMEPREFMANATVNYVESWAVIHLLRDSSHPAFKGVLDRYFDALLAGKSRREAYDEVFAPMVETLQAALAKHVSELPGK
jgi:tetratricopeptide (TPR) repeat protein